MKLLTLNTHSLTESAYQEKLSEFVCTIISEKPDIIALQEVNQSIDSQIVPDERLKNYFPCGSIPVHEDNHAYSVVNLLDLNGLEYHWTWLGIKRGYDILEEGIALLSRSPVLNADAFTVSSFDDYENWKTRKIVGIQTEKYPESRFYSIHLGWWSDDEEPFQNQWKKLCSYMENKGRVWLMGDFNSPAGQRNQGYDMIINSGWYDSFVLAAHKDDGITVVGTIDGWKGRNEAVGMRIDQIWCNEKADVISSEVIFNGKNRAVISDHYGVITEIKD